MTWSGLPGPRKEESWKVLQKWSRCYIVLCVSVSAFNEGQAERGRECVCMCVCVRGLLIDFLGVTSVSNLQ